MDAIVVHAGHDDRAVTLDLDEYTPAALMEALRQQLALPAAAPELLVDGEPLEMASDGPIPAVLLQHIELRYEFADTANATLAERGVVADAATFRAAVVARDDDLIRLLVASRALPPQAVFSELAAALGDEARLLYLAQRLDVNAIGRHTFPCGTTDFNVSPLIAAAAAPHTRAVGILIDYGADVRCRSAQGRTAFAEAARNNLPDLCATLAARGADVNCRLARGWTPLFACVVGRGPPRMVEELLNLGADVHAVCNGRTALVAAAGSGQVDTASVLLAAGAAVDPQGTRTTPLLTAADAGCPAMCDLLLRRGAVVDAPETSTGRSPLVAAATVGNVALVQRLLAAKADVNVVCNRTTPLLEAARRGQAAVCKKLLAAGADPNAVDAKNESPLTLAVRTTQPVQLLEQLVKAGADVDHRGTQTALVTAINTNAYAAAARLVELGANVREALPAAVARGDCDRAVGAKVWDELCGMLLAALPREAGSVEVLDACRRMAVSRGRRNFEVKVSGVLRECAGEKGDAAARRADGSRQKALQAQRKYLTCPFCGAWRPRSAKGNGKGKGGDGWFTLGGLSRHVSSCRPGEWEKWRREVFEKAKALFESNPAWGLQ